MRQIDQSNMEITIFDAERNESIRLRLREIRRFEDCYNFYDKRPGAVQSYRLSSETIESGSADFIKREHQKLDEEERKAGRNPNDCYYWILPTQTFRTYMKDFGEYEGGVGQVSDECHDVFFWDRIKEEK